MKRIYESEFDRQLYNGIGRGIVKAVAIGFVLFIALVYSALRLWVVLQGGR